MPVESCQKEGEPGFRWGPTGKCYTYVEGNAQSRNEAIAKAQEQGRAIEARREER
jgi:hypothetical protein